MKKLSALVVTLLMIYNVDAQLNKFIGTWQGILDIGSEIRFVLLIKDDGKGGLQTIAKSPDQSTQELPCEVTTVDGNSITVEMQVMQASYKGRLENDSLISGTFSQGNASLPLVLKKQEGQPQKMLVKRPQTPQPPFPYDSHDVEFDNPDKSVHLAGTLTVPRSPSAATFPVVVIISGSGTQDRNGTMLGHQPYYVLADHLTRQGIAVLRVDDRGAGKSTAGNYNVTSAEYAKDVEVCIDFLRSRKDIDKKKIGLIGHSEGGIIAPMVAARRKDVAYLVLWGAPVIGGKAINTEQNVYQLKKAGFNEDAVQSFKNFHESVLSLFGSSADSIALEKNVKMKWNEWKQKQSPVIQQQLLISGDSILGQSVYAIYNSLYQLPWMRYFISYDPTSDLSKVKVPVLAITGSKDTQVEATTNLALTQKIFQQSRLKSYEIVAPDALNHLLQTAVTGDTDEYATIEETIAPSALTIISDWILKKTR